MTDEKQYYDDTGKLILRLTVGGLMLFHGVAKLLNPGTVEFIGGQLSDSGLPSLLAYGVYLGEIVAPLMIIAGVLTRVGGLIIVINMLFAVLLMHTGDLLSLTEHGGWRLELQGFYFFGGLALMFLGSGRLAVKPC
jgi:putative oxidoreductase